MGPPRQRAVLAALAVEAGRVVPVEVVVDRVWGPDPPARVRRTLHAYIARVRRVVEQSSAAPGGGPVRVVRRAGGYVLDVEADRVDLLRFRRLAAEARRGERSDAERVGLLGEALGLWRGVPLAGLAGDWVARQRDSWQLERLEAVLEWARAGLRLGQYAQVIPVARDLAEEYPHNEALAVVLGWALAGDGRRDEAAEHCARICHRLRTELGADPGPVLRELQQAVLGDQPLPALTPPPRPAATPPAVPAQLPGDVPGFAGRAEHLARLDTLLATDATAASTAVVITAVSGTAGVGKTALAVRWAHRVRDQFPDGQLYVNLRGFDPSGRVVDPVTAVRGFLDALGVPKERIPIDLDAQAALYRSLLSGKRVLVVLDNARDADHARPLLPAAPTAVAVVTSRDPLAGLVAADGAHPLILDLLTHDEAADLLARHLGGGRVAAEPDAVERIIAACARLPLALSLVAARARHHRSASLATVAGQLPEVGDRTGQLDAGDLLDQVQVVFSWSYRALSPAAARLFRLLGLHPGPDTTAPAAASLTAGPLPQTRRLLADLVRAGLLHEPVPGRYGFHDLLAAYATQLTHTQDSQDEREAAMVRLLDYYTHTAHTAARHLNPVRDPIPVPLTPPAPGTTPEQPGDHDTALGWLDAELPVLLAAQQHAADTGRDTHAWQLAWALDTVLFRRGRWHERAGAWQTALPAAGRLPHPAAAYTHRSLGHAATRLGDHGQAHTHLHDALHQFTEAVDPVGQAHAHYDLSYLWERRGRPDLALDHAQQALTLYQAAGHRQGHAHGLNAVGWDHALLGDHTAALTHCQQALTLFRQVGDRYGQAITWDSLGYAHHHLGHHTHATDSYTHALTLVRDLGDRYNEATTLTRLGDTHHAAGHPEAARTAWTTALTILTDLRHPDADTLRTKLATLNQSPGTAPGLVDSKVE